MNHLRCKDHSKDDQRADDHEQAGADQVGQSLRHSEAFVFAGCLKRGLERRRERPLCKQVAQEVGEPKSGRKSIPVKASSEERREDLFTHQAE